MGLESMRILVVCSHGIYLISQAKTEIKQAHFNQKYRERTGEGEISEAIYFQDFPQKMS
jgi:hypothetical protein